MNNREGTKSGVYFSLARSNSIAPVVPRGRRGVLGEVLRALERGPCGVRFVMSVRTEAPARRAVRAGRSTRSLSRAAD